MEIIGRSDVARLMCQKIKNWPIKAFRNLSQLNSKLEVSKGGKNDRNK